MKKQPIILCFLLWTAVAAFAQERIDLPLWPDGVPESNGITAEEINENNYFSNVSVPAMSVFKANPDKNTGAALIICPGGGYARQAAGHEGFQLTGWLNENGITAIVLKYRLPNGHDFIPSKDALQAIRIVRSKAEEWGINPSKIGISGFSAGGHLASTAGTHFDYGNPEAEDPIARQSSRPDYMILFYPVISMKEGVTHVGSKRNLLGDNPTEEQMLEYSNELKVSAETPPTLLLLSDDDKGVIPQNSLDFYAALKNHKVPAAMYIFPEGGHGWGYKESFRYHHVWRILMIEWMMQQKILPDMIRQQN
jgi:acetyl esterase/lipase